MTRAGGMLLLLGLSGCQFPFAACPDVLVWGVSVGVVDSITGSPVVAEDLRVIATDGAYADTARVLDPRFPGVPILVVKDRAGTYRVDVLAEGYRPWVRDGIRVSKENRCDVRTTSLTARMQRLDST